MLVSSGTLLASLVAITSARFLNLNSLHKASAIDRLESRSSLDDTVAATNTAKDKEWFDLLGKRATASKTAPFVVNGTKIPDVNFDVGQSYAGLLPISSDPKESSKLYFWYFPSQNPAASNEITVWLNGGPGCSSLEGLLQENGPISWQPGTYSPVRNPWSWTNLTNMIWIEMPVGTGFDQGLPNNYNESTVADQFMGFWKNFFDTFDLQGREIYLTGESYAGAYIPYIADAMLKKNDTKYGNVQGIMLNDPVLSTEAVMMQVPAVSFVDANPNTFPLNATTMKKIHSDADTCGYTDFLQKYLTYPPPSGGHMPSPRKSIDSLDECDVWHDVKYAMQLINPCFNIYNILDTCPLKWDVLGFPGTDTYIPPGAQVYFNRSDVQRAINAPQKRWTECPDPGVAIFGLRGGDSSPPSSYSVLPNLIGRLNRTIIAHGSMDFVVMANSSLLAIQNMTWNGAQGFQSRPSDEFYVPYHTVGDKTAMGGAGVMGTTHTERGLTYVQVSLSGHMIPQFAPTAAYRMVEYMLGRISNLTQHGSFTTDQSASNS